MSNHDSQVRHVVVPQGNDGQRIDNYLLSLLPGVPRSHVYRLLRSGQVRVDGARAKPHRRVHSGETVRLPPVRTATRSEGRRPPDDLLRRVRERVLLEDDHYLVLDKPAGLPAHAGTGADFGVIEVVRAWERHDYIELAHRLDRDTSGIIVLAKSRPALLRAQQALGGGGADKRYIAFCVGSWRGGPRTVTSALRIEREAGQKRARAAEDGKAAASEFLPMTCTRYGALCEVRIGTGRMHQIRAHAESIGHPVAGDRHYGTREQHAPVRDKGGLRRLFLHAHRLRLPATDDFEGLAIESPLPEELRAVVTRLEGG
ncbi:MAG: RluA family pseudouridine synthase [Algiphilus sp.]|uniref:RluA family pseudouridine synthase n=1 Tax=Algiphilus sp. TaxID=1872431 RepID=UPI0032EE0051